MVSIQELYLYMVRITSSPTFNGESISEALQANEALIRCFIPANSKGSLRSLYRLAQGTLEIDTLYLLVNKYDVALVRRIISEWNPTSITTISGKELEGGAGLKTWESDDYVALRVYWEI